MLTLDKAPSPAQIDNQKICPSMRQGTNTGSIDTLLTEGKSIIYDIKAAERRFIKAQQLFLDV
jgi:hypothetical protein